jgi:transcriptional regulator with XRE-family HTH domain
VSQPAPNHARVIPLHRPRPAPPRGEGATPNAVPVGPPRPPDRLRDPAGPRTAGHTPPTPAVREPLWRDLVGDALRRERLAQERTLKEVAEAARISMPYLSELERGRKEASSEILAAAARALGLGLGDLLSLAQDELTRHVRRTSAVRGRPTAPTAPYDGLCLAA